MELANLLILSSLCSLLVAILLFLIAALLRPQIPVAAFCHQQIDSELAVKIANEGAKRRPPPNSRMAVLNSFYEISLDEENGQEKRKARENGGEREAEKTTTNLPEILVTTASMKVRRI